MSEEKRVEGRYLSMGFANPLESCINLALRNLNMYALTLRDVPVVFEEMKRQNYLTISGVTLAQCTEDVQRKVVDALIHESLEVKQVFNDTFGDDITF